MINFRRPDAAIMTRGALENALQSQRVYQSRRRRFFYSPRCGPGASRADRCADRLRTGQRFWPAARPAQHPLAGAGLADRRVEFGFWPASIPMPGDRLRRLRAEACEADAGEELAHGWRPLPTGRRSTLACCLQRGTSGLHRCSSCSIRRMIEYGIDLARRPRTAGEGHSTVRSSHRGSRLYGPSFPLCPSWTRG
jgi:hypothetical protein